MTLKGTIDRYSRKGDFGFIVSGAEEFFFHVRSLPDNKRQPVGTEVLFERRVETPKRKHDRAINIVCVPEKVAA